MLWMWHIKAKKTALQNSWPMAIYKICNSNCSQDA